MASTRKRLKIAYDGEDPEDMAVEGAAAAAAAAPAEEPGALKTNGVLPSANLPGLDTQDNAAIALKLIKAGTPLVVNGKEIGVCAHDIPEGHRFAVEPITAGTEITSWALPFGVALRDLAAGEYLCNVKVLTRMADDMAGLHLPKEPTFENVAFRSYDLKADGFCPAASKVAGLSEAAASGATFDGIARPDGRGTGTRNYVVVIGVTSDLAGFARAVANSYDDDAALKAKGIDGVVAVAHTEGGGSGGDAAVAPTNEDKVIRTLAGFVVHPNIGGVCLVDRPENRLRAEHVKAHLDKGGYPYGNVPVRFISVDSAAAFADERARVSEAVAELVEAAAGATREPRPLSELTVAQQCGGSDAFSGISANPLIGWVSRQIVAAGGGVVLAETDELIGAESYVLAKLNDHSTGKKFLELIERFYKYAEEHGHSPEGNPSGGNLYRGLYNITLKSAGAAMKKSPDVRLDNVLEYGEFLGARKGYSFMDSPGNDLESIAGQVATGCNLVTFTTGNGAITNFPFVPTVKVLTTSVRYELLSKEMDINAGKYLDGSQTMDELGKDTLDYIVKVASGKRSKGELAGHHQVHLWREWFRTEGAPEEVINGDGTRSGKPMALGADGAVAADGVVSPPKLRDMKLCATPKEMTHLPSFVSERVAMIVPTSLCSSQVSQKLTNRLNDAKAAKEANLDRVVTLPHTEGCGASSGDSENMFIRTILGYAVHPLVSAAVLVEHGCEKTHNSRMSAVLTEMGINPAVFGYASIQLDGGIEGAFTRVNAHMRGIAAVAAPRELAPPSHLRVGLVSTCGVPKPVARVFAAVARAIVDVGGIVVASGTVVGADFMHSLLQDAADGQSSTLGYGQRAATPGLHTMHASTANIAELLTGVGATGVEVIVAFVEGSCAEPHPLIPVVQTTHAGVMKDADIKFSFGADGEAAEAQRLADTIQRIYEREDVPKLYQSANTHVQIPRGTKGISL